MKTDLIEDELRVMFLLMSLPIIVDFDWSTEKTANLNWFNKSSLLDIVTQIAENKFNKLLIKMGKMLL